jgi:acetyl-CoA C-acetyltransferase
MSELEGLDPRTPVVVGVGEASERIDDPGYAGLSAVDLASAAALEALEDCVATPEAMAGSIDTVAGVRQFENSTPAASAADLSDHSPSRRSTNRRLLLGQVRALAWSFIRILLGGGWVAPSAFKETRMNNVVRDYN